MRRSIAIPTACVMALACGGGTVTQGSSSPDASDARPAESPDAAVCRSGFGGGSGGVTYSDGGCEWFVKVPNYTCSWTCSCPGAVCDCGGFTVPYLGCPGCSMAADSGDVASLENPCGFVYQ
jgi:hypothetical protein